MESKDKHETMEKMATNLGGREGTRLEKHNYRRKIVSNFIADAEIKSQDTMMEFAGEADKYIKQSRLRL